MQGLQVGLHKWSSSHVLPLPAGCCDRRGEAVLAPRARGKDSLNPSDTLDQNLSRVGQMPSRRQPRRPMGWERHRSCRGWLLAERAALPRCRARTPSTLTRACPGQARPGPGSAPPALGAPGGGGAAPLRARPRCRRRPGLDAEAWRGASPAGGLSRVWAPCGCGPAAPCGLRPPRLLAAARSGMEAQGSRRRQLPVLLLWGKWLAGPRPGGVPWGSPLLPRDRCPGPAEHPRVCAVPESSAFCRGVGLKFGEGGSAPLRLEHPFGTGLRASLPAVRMQRRSFSLRGSPSRAERRLRSERVGAAPGGQRGRAWPQGRWCPSASRPHRPGESPDRAPRPQGKPSQTSSVSRIPDGFWGGVFGCLGKVFSCRLKGWFLLEYLSSEHVVILRIPSKHRYPSDLLLRMPRLLEKLFYCSSSGRLF